MRPSQGTPAVEAKEIIGARWRLGLGWLFVLGVIEIEEGALVEVVSRSHVKVLAESLL
jgi:hypothetical protein